MYGHIFTKIYIYRVQKYMIVIVGLSEGNTGKQKRKREGYRLNNIEIHCICILDALFLVSGGSVFWNFLCPVAFSRILDMK
jgi:hypothetical protein